jgi:hypothetical protein
MRGYNIALLMFQYPGDAWRRLTSNDAVQGDFISTVVTSSSKRRCVARISVSLGAGSQGKRKDYVRSTTAGGSLEREGLHRNPNRLVSRF